MKIHRQFFGAVTLLFFSLFTSIYGQNKIDLNLVASGFSIPVDIAFDHNNNLFVVEKQGRVILVKNGEKTTFLDITDRVNSSANERGLLGLTFHPEYESNGYFYVNYSGPSGETTISRFHVSTTNPELGDPASEKIILTVAQPFNNHNGGDLNFGPDGYLYIGMGDGGLGGDPGNRSQNPQNRLGKMLRIDINTETESYLLPSDNPFIHTTDTLPEIWAFGLRNPWRFSFDALSGDMWIADVGQNKWEEIDFEAAGNKGGINYGWRCFEGLVKYDFSQCDESNKTVPPILVYANNPSGEGCSITGGFVYRGNDLPYLQTYYIYGDFCSGKVWRLKKNACGEYINEKIYQHSSNSISTFGQDKQGEIFMASMGDGKIYKLAAKCTIAASVDTVFAPSCFDGNDGRVIFAVSGADNYSVNIDGADLPTNLAPGTYHYTLAQEDNTCLQKGCFTIPQGENPSLCQIHATILLCAQDSLVFDGEGCENLKVDSLILYKDNLPIKQAFSLNFVLRDPGVYAIKYYIGTCDFYLDSMFLVEADSITEKVTISYDGSIALASGNFSKYLMYKNGFPLAVNNNGIFELNADSLGTYVFYGINDNGCLSPPSEPLIISSINDYRYSPIRISPNPANDHINIVGEEILELSLFDTNGKRIYFSNQNVSGIDVSTFPAGLYILQVKRTKELIGFKVEIMR